MRPILFLQGLLAKAHIKGYTKKDGTVVQPHDTKAPSASPAPSPVPKASGAKWSALGSMKGHSTPPPPPQKIVAPQLGLFGGGAHPSGPSGPGSKWAGKPEAKPLPKDAVAH